MNTLNTKIYEGLTHAGTVAFLSNTTTTNSAWISMANFIEVMATVFVGTVGSGGTVDAKFQQATDSSGTGAKDISGKAIVQMLVANKQAQVNLRAGELDIANSFNYVQFSVTVGTAACVTGAVIHGMAKYGTPDSLSTSLNASTLVQQIA